MELIADALLIAGAAGAALYCRALGARLNRLKDLDSGLGAAIAALSRQVDDLRASLEAAKDMGGDQKRELAQLAARAESAAGRLELLLASLHEGGGRKSAAPAGRRSRLFDEEEEEEASPAAQRTSSRRGPALGPASEPDPFSNDADDERADALRLAERDALELGRRARAAGSGGAP